MSDVEPEPVPGAPADLDKQGGFKDPNATTPDADSDYAGKSEVEEDSADPRGGEGGGGMIGEG